MNQEPWSPKEWWMMLAFFTVLAVVALLSFTQWLSGYLR
jgi:hypothetical protein